MAQNRLTAVGRVAAKRVADRGELRHPGPRPSACATPSATPMAAATPMAGAPRITMPRMASATSS